MTISCPKCGHQGKVDPSKIPPQGAKAKCPKCQSGFLIRKPAEQQPATPAAPPAAREPAPSAPADPAPVPPSPQPEEPRVTEPAPQATVPSSPEPSLGFAEDEPALASGGGLSLKAPSPEAVAAKDVACTGCLKLFKEDEVSRVGDRVLCQSCQESMQAKAQVPSASGARPPYGIPFKKPSLDFAGFWIRVGAYAVDAVILALVWHFALSPIFIKIGSSMMAESTAPLTMSQDPSLSEAEQMEEMMNQMANAFGQMSEKMAVWVWAVQLVGIILVAGYFTFLEGGPGQTVGKKALGLRVVTPEGERVGYLKAFARFIGKIISTVILGIGFLLAAFDSEKRTLHDRMCDTRVIRV